MSLIRRGRLVLVGTPIGNLGDLTIRARDALHDSKVVVCEDTRRAGQLLRHVGADRPELIVANEHSEFSVIERVLERLGAGQTVLVTSDAGMPAISDPGFQLVRAALDAGFAVDVAPGPTAMTAALVLSGLPTERFVFEGFLPRSGSERTQRLGAIGSELRTVVLYEAPHRVRKTLSDLAAACGDGRPVCVARELTKKHQELVRGTLVEAVGHFDLVEPRGEFVLVVGPASEERPAVTDDELLERLQAELDAGASTRDAVSTVTAISGVGKRRVYDLALTIGR